MYIDSKRTSTAFNDIIMSGKMKEDRKTVLEE